MSSSGDTLALREGTSVDRDEVVALPRSVDAAEAAN